MTKLTDNTAAAIVCGHYLSSYETAPFQLVTELRAAVLAGSASVRGETAAIAVFTTAEAYPASVYESITAFELAVEIVSLFNSIRKAQA